MLAGFNDTSAYALCTFGYCEGPGHEPIIFEGKTPVRVIIKVKVYIGWSVLFIGQDCSIKRAYQLWMG